MAHPTKEKRDTREMGEEGDGEKTEHRSIQPERFETMPLI
jgi:hypothetical protein